MITVNVYHWDNKNLHYYYYYMYDQYNISHKAACKLGIVPRYADDKLSRESVSCKSWQLWSRLNIYKTIIMQQPAINYPTTFR